MDEFQKALAKMDEEMFDLRKYKAIIREAVAEECEADRNWSWVVKAVHKTEIKICWGYLDYCHFHVQTPFIIKLCKSSFPDTGTTWYLHGYLPGGGYFCESIGNDRWDDYSSIECAIAGVIHHLAWLAHETY